MNFSLVIPFLLGAIGITQGMINRQMSANIGLTQTVFIGNIVTILVCVVLVMLVKFFPQAFPEIFQFRSGPTSFKWWYIIPGIFGFIIVAGLPYAIYKLGAVKVTVGLIVAQMVVSVLWDIFVEKIPLNLAKSLGLLLAGLSTLLITLSK
jgi:transporter family-2 protein